VENRQLSRGSSTYCLKSNKSNTGGRQRGASMEHFLHAVDTAGVGGCVQADTFFGEPYGVVSHGVYGVAFEHYFRVFDQRQFLHILTDDFKADPDAMVKTVERFLGLPEYGEGERARLRGGAGVREGGRGEERRARTSPS
jgi:hypothetical protein